MYSVLSTEGSETQNRWVRQMLSSASPLFNVKLPNPTAICRRGRRVMGRTRCIDLKVQRRDRAIQGTNKRACNSYTLIARYNSPCSNTCQGPRSMSSDTREA